MTLFWKFFQGLIWWQSDFFYNLDTLYIYDLWVFVNPVHLQIQSTSTLQGCVNDPFKEVLSRLDGKPWKDIDRVAAVKRYKKSLDKYFMVGCPKYSKHLIFDLIWTFRILRIQDLNIFELWISVFASIRFELRIFRISRIYSTPWLGLIFEWNWAELAVLISW